MVTGPQVKILVGIVLLAWLAALAAGGHPVPVSFLSPFSTVATVLTISVYVFDTWLWRCRIFHGWLVKRPNIRGTWRVQIDSSFVDPSTGEKSPPIVGFFVVRQRYFGLGMRLLTKESTSTLQAWSIRDDEDGVYTVSAIYQNEPRIGVRDQSEIHHGSFLLHCSGHLPASLLGHYWTDRNTRGELSLDQRTFALFDNFASAEAAYAVSQRNASGGSRGT